MIKKERFFIEEKYAYRKNRYAYRTITFFLFDVL